MRQVEEHKYGERRVCLEVRQQELEDEVHLLRVQLAHLAGHLCDHRVITITSSTLMIQFPRTEFPFWSKILGRCDLLPVVALIHEGAYRLVLGALDELLEGKHCLLGRLWGVNTTMTEDVVIEVMAREGTSGEPLAVPKRSRRVEAKR